jgi:hypothetical protein
MMVLHSLWVGLRPKKKVKAAMTTPTTAANPMRLGLIGRIKTDEKLLYHRPLPGRIPGLLVNQPPQPGVVVPGH